MKFLYTLLFALSIILINPWGMSRGEIWTQPKLVVLLLLCLLNLSILWKQRQTLTLSRSWKISRLLWELFLGIGLLSTLLSPFPWRSFWGQSEMGDGLLYWIVIAAFTLSNALLLKLHPELVRPQLKGLLVGGIILAISIFPQVINWHIDYTVTTGQLLSENILKSTIFQAHQPIGFYSHRGHASFVLAATVILSLLAWQLRWISRYWLITTGILILLALLFTQTRASIIALILSITFLLGRKYFKILIPAALVCLLVVALNTTNRNINNLPLIKQLTSDRIYLWELSMKGIRQRPLLGWGFDGFGIAYPFVVSSNQMSSVVGLGDNSFNSINQNGELRIQPLISNKAHNLILDTMLSVGVLGLLCYGTLLGFGLWGVIPSPYRGMGAIAIAYLCFTLTWFECAQFTHIAWWALSLAEVNLEAGIALCDRAPQSESY